MICRQHDEASEVLVEKGVIELIGKHLPKTDEEIDLQGRLVVPPYVDPHLQMADWCTDSPIAVSQFIQEIHSEPYVDHAGGASGSWRVPEGHCFLLGDNRAASSDGRSWKQSFTPLEAILGRVCARRS